MPKSKSRKKPAKAAKKPKSRQGRARHGGKAIDPADLPRVLADLPLLVFEPEFAPAGFDPEEVRQAHKDRLSDPATIERLGDLAMHARLLICINNLMERAYGAKDDTLFFLGDAARFYIEDYRGPAWDNPLVVALYLRTLHQMKGRPVTPEVLKDAVKEYERVYRDEMQEKWAALELLRS